MRQDLTFCSVFSHVVAPSPAELRAQSDEIVLLTEEEFMSVSELIRARAKLDDVNRVKHSLPTAYFVSVLFVCLFFILCVYNIRPIISPYAELLSFQICP